MTNSNEQMLLSIQMLSKRHKLSLIDAAIEYCKRNGTDVEDFAEMIDDNIKQQLRVSAMQERMVVMKEGPKLFD